MRGNAQLKLFPVLVVVPVFGYTVCQMLGNIALFVYQRALLFYNVE